MTGRPVAAATAGVDPFDGLPDGSGARPGGEGRAHGRHADARRRLFIGLMAPAPVREQIAAYRARWTWPASAKLTPVENFHLTLAFLGQVGEVEESALRAGLAAVHFPPFELRLHRPGRFLEADIAFVAPEPEASLAGLYGDVRQVVEGCGMAVRGDWHPHLTLARRAAAAVAPVEGAGIAWAVDAFSLVVSAGGRYEPVEGWHATPSRDP